MNLAKGKNIRDGPLKQFFRSYLIFKGGAGRGGGGGGGQEDVSAPIFFLSPKVLSCLLFAYRHSISILEKSGPVFSKTIFLSSH